MPAHRDQRRNPGRHARGYVRRAEISGINQQFFLLDPMRQARHRFAPAWVQYGVWRWTLAPRPSRPPAGYLPPTPPGR